jgi:hypothetical protein
MASTPRHSLTNGDGICGDDGANGDDERQHGQQQQEQE